MWDIIVGLIVGILSLVLLFAGLRAFFLALPIIGFIAGFFVGAAGVRAIFGDGFLSTVTGVLIGLVVAVLFAVLAYFLWYIGALLAMGSTGALIGSGFMNAIGVDSGWAVFIVSAAVFIVFVVVAFLIALPIWVVLVNTAFIGAAGVIAGILLIFNQIDRGDLGYGVAWATIEESWFWLIAWIVLATIGILAQLQTMVAARLPDDRWSPAQPAPAV